MRKMISTRRHRRAMSDGDRFRKLILPRLNNTPFLDRRKTMKRPAEREQTRSNRIVPTLNARYGGFF